MEEAGVNAELNFGALVGEALEAVPN